MNKLPDVFIVVGFVAVMTGIYRVFGVDATLILGGTILTVAGAYAYLKEA